jgi:hypothetical protein
VGNPGPQAYFYWLVANYSVGQAPVAGPFVMVSAPNTLSVSNFVTVVPVYPAGATSLDLLRTTTPFRPSGACNCAVSTGNTSGGINDQSNSLNAYTVNPIDMNRLNETLTNEVQSSGVSHLILRQNGVFVVDLNIVAFCAGGCVDLTTNQTIAGNKNFTGLMQDGTGTPASQITLPVPTVFSAEEGTTGARVTGMNINTPGEYLSRWDASTNASCAAGLLDACASPLARIDYTNGGTGTLNTGVGLLINMWGFQGVTPSGQNGGAEIGIGVAAFDKVGETGNTNIRGANFNVGVNGIASQVDRSGFTRSVVAAEDDLTNGASADCVFIATSGSGNYCVGHTIVTVGSFNSTIGLGIGTSSGTSGIGYLTGVELSGVKNVGYAVYQGNTMNPTANYYAAAGGTYGFFAGAQTFTPPKNSTETEVNPTVAYLADSTPGAAANSLPVIWRAFAGDTSHINEWNARATNANTAWRMSFGNNCTTFPCPSYTDVYLLTSIGQSLQGGDVCGDYQGTLGSGTGDECLHALATPTGLRQVGVPDGNSSVPMVNSLATLAVTSENVTIQGMTASGHCGLTPTNAAGATNIATTFVSAKSANQITVSHTATANMNYDIWCTAN